MFPAAQAISAKSRSVTMAALSLSLKASSRSSAKGEVSFILKAILEVTFKTTIAADVVLNRGSDSVLPAAFPYYPGKF